jgi:predicted transposase YbfD/YdcC
MSFLSHFSDLSDPRSHINVKHNFLDVMFLAVSAVLSGAEGWSDIEDFGRDKLTWLKQYRRFENGIPVDDTIARIIRVVCPKQLNQAFLNWVNEIRVETGKPQIAIDGKTLRHSYDGDKHTALHSITAWSKDAGIVLAQLKSSGKKNENASVLEMLDTLDIKGALISADAMNSQKKIVAKIQAGQADYVLCIKNNQKSLREEISAYFHKVQRDTPEIIAHDEQTDAGHGRIEVRRCQQLLVSEWITEAKHWEGMRSIIKLERERHVKGKPTTIETQFYISSLGIAPQATSQAIRAHWEVENKAHWVLDVTYKEDDCRIRKDDGAENVGVIRRFCLNMARLHPKKASMRRKLKIAGWADEFRTELIFG